MNRAAKSNERGAALVLALMMMAVLGIFATAYWSRLHATLATVRTHTKDVAARALAESGVERALAELRSGNKAFEGLPYTALGDGVYKVAIAPAESPAKRIITGIGGLGTAKEPLHVQTVRAEVMLDGAGAPVSVQYLTGAR